MSVGARKAIGARRCAARRAHEERDPFLVVRRPGAGPRRRRSAGRPGRQLERRLPARVLEIVVVEEDGAVLLRRMPQVDLAPRVQLCPVTARIGMLTSRRREPLPETSRTRSRRDVAREVPGCDHDAAALRSLGASIFPLSRAPRSSGSPFGEGPAVASCSTTTSAGSPGKRRSGRCSSRTRSPSKRRGDEASRRRPACGAPVLNVTPSSRSPRSPSASTKSPQPRRSPSFHFETIACGPLPGVVGQSQAETANGPSTSSSGAWSTIPYEPRGYDCSRPSYSPSTEVVDGPHLPARPFRLRVAVEEPHDRCVEARMDGADHEPDRVARCNAPHVAVADDPHDSNPVGPRSPLVAPVISATRSVPSSAHGRRSRRPSRRGGTRRSGRRRGARAACCG